MRWLPWRRKQARERSPYTPTSPNERSGAVVVAERPSRSVAPLPPAIIEPRGAALVFARDALALSGAQVRVEDPDLLAATLPDGTRARYTGSLARARGEVDAALLVQGGAALGALLDEVALRGGCVAFALPTSGDPTALAAAALAKPPSSCGRCTEGADAESIALCAECPLRAGKLALRGVGRIAGARETRRREAVAVELTYRVVYRDREGRRGETHRLAYDTETGEPVLPVALEALAACEPHPVAATLDIGGVAQRAQADLERTLEAGAALLALRAEAEYQRRLHDLALTHARLLRESPESRAELDASHSAERARLADLFAVGVEAELVGVASVTTTLAAVALRHAGGDLTLVVDTGRGVVLPPRCAACGAPTCAGALCAQDHMICASCSSGTEVAATCPVCAGKARAGAPTSGRPRGARDEAANAGDAFAVERLADLSEPLWQSFVSWYLAAEGYVAEGAPAARHGLAAWRLEAEAGPEAGSADAHATGAGCAVAVRPKDARRLGAAEVHAALDDWRDESYPVKVLVTSAATDAEAQRAAAASGVQLVDRDVLAAFLGHLATAHASALAEAEHEAQARAQAAVEAQRALLSALTAIEKDIAICANNRRVTGRGPLTTATHTISAAMHEAERALVAWETLVTDWLASFDERPAPDGSLHILRTPEELRALAERAEHLRAALARPLGALSGTPNAGESGYTTWRKALLEQLTAACEALSWRTSVVNLELWHDATTARDSSAAAHAETAAQAVKHTTARAAKARDLLAGRIGL